MRIVYVLPQPELGGGNKVIFQHARLLREAGCEVTVLGEGAEPRWTRLDLPYRDYAAGPVGLPEQDLVVATYWTTLAVARRLALGPLAHFCQGYEGALAHLEPRRHEIEAAYRSPLPSLAVAPHLCELLARRFARECRVVPPPLDPLFQPRWRRQPRRRPWIAIPGIFEAEVKGVPTALAAVRRLRGSGCRCRVLRFSALPLSPQERALLEPDLYLCAVPPERIARALRRCDLLLLASRADEGFGLPLLEAMGAKVPAIASRIPSTEFIGGAARLVPAGDDAAFAAAARELLASGREWRRARAAGRRAAERFLPARIAPLLADAMRWARARALSAAARSTHPEPP